MARDEKIIITKYHGHCVASSCGRCLQRFCEMYDKTCQGTNKKCPFYAETGVTRAEIIKTIKDTLWTASGENLTDDEEAEAVLNALIDKGVAI